MQVDDNHIIDHKNGNTLDNRRENLRICTYSENNRNRKQISSNNKSGYKGVSWDKQKNKWRTCLNINKKQKHIGFFNDIIEAAKAYNEAAIKYFGEFAKLNKIKE